MVMCSLEHDQHHLGGACGRHPAVLSDRRGRGWGGVAEEWVLKTWQQSSVSAFTFEWAGKGRSE